MIELFDGEGVLEMNFFGATGARMGGMEFDMEAFVGAGFDRNDPNLSAEDSGTDYMPGDPFKDPFAVVPWGQGPEAFGNFDHEGHSNFAVTGFFDHEHGEHVGFDEFGGPGGKDFDDYENVQFIPPYV